MHDSGSWHMPKNDLEAELYGMFEVDALPDLW